MPPPSLRRAAPEDIEAVHAIYMHETVSPFLAHDAMGLELFGAVYADLMASGLMICEADGRVAGFYRTLRYDGRARHVAMLSTVAVHPDFQGRGLARPMIEDAIDRLFSEGVTRIELTAEADNSKGLAFYKNLGFEIEGVSRKSYKRAGEDEHVDHILMARLQT